MSDMDDYTDFLDKTSSGMIEADGSKKKVDTKVINFGMPREEHTNRVAKAMEISGIKQSEFMRLGALMLADKIIDAGGYNATKFETYEAQIKDLQDRVDALENK